jgi:uncharacterized protein with PIN domain
MMYNPDDPPTLDCQDCGEPIRVLTQRQARMLAETPYEFLAYCPDCKKYHKYGDL